MKIKIIQTVDYDCLLKQWLNIDGKDMYRVQSLSECPEDACIGRDLIDCEDLYHMFQLGYKAGKENKQIDYSLEEVKSYNGD